MKIMMLVMCSAITVYASPASARATKAKRTKPGVTANTKEKPASTEPARAGATAAPETVATSTSEAATSAATVSAPVDSSTAAASSEPASSTNAAPSPEPTVVATPTATVAPAHDSAPTTTVTTETTAQHDPPPGMGIRVGAKVGVAVPTSKLGAAPVFGIDAEYRLPMLDRLLGIAAEFAYSAPSASGNGTDPATGDFSYKLGTRITSFALEAIARRAFDRIEPYGGVGYSIVLLHDQTSAFAVKTTESQTRAGFQLRGGCGYRLGPGHVFGEARYQFAHFGFESTGSASAGTFDVFAGYRFAL